MGSRKTKFFTYWSGHCKGGVGKGCASKKKEPFFNMALLAQKLWRIFCCQNPFPAILRQNKNLKNKVPMATRP